MALNACSVNYHTIFQVLLAVSLACSSFSDNYLPQKVQKQVKVVFYMQCQMSALSLFYFSVFVAIPCYMLLCAVAMQMLSYPLRKKAKIEQQSPRFT
jgi:hypothetical protein